jgi:hypothetical protein
LIQISLKESREETEMKAPVSFGVPGKGLQEPVLGRQEQMQVAAFANSTRNSRQHKQLQQSQWRLQIGTK